MHPEREAELELYHRILQLVCTHGQHRDKILKAFRIKLNPEGTMIKEQTFEWHWKKVKKVKKQSFNK